MTAHNMKQNSSSSYFIDNEDDEKHINRGDNYTKKSSSSESYFWDIEVNLNELRELFKELMELARENFKELSMSLMKTIAILDKINILKNSNSGGSSGFNAKTSGNDFEGGSNYYP
jgi:hypothetical protein